MLEFCRRPNSIGSLISGQYEHSTAISCQYRRQCYLSLLCLDYEQFLFFLSPSSEKPGDTLNDHARDCREDGRGTTPRRPYRPVLNSLHPPQ